MRIARRSADPFLRLLTATATLWVMGQVFINVGYVVGLLPVTGLQLPLISAGGTSTATTLLMVGVMANAARHEPEAVAALRAGRDDGSTGCYDCRCRSRMCPAAPRRCATGCARAEVNRRDQEGRPAAACDSWRGAKATKAAKPATSRARKPTGENRRQTATAARAVRAPRHHGDGRDRKGRRVRTLEGQHYG